METPVLDFLSHYQKSGFSRFHMPGHKGKNLFDLSFALDITEIHGADSLFEAEGIIAQSEQNASKLFGTHATIYSTGGSTLGIQTMLLSCCEKGSEIISARNAHIAFYNACALFDFSPIWVYPQYHDEMSVSGSVTPAQIEQKLIKHPTAKTVYITSPDYMGHMSDIKGIADVCKKHDAVLLVDNAHGAHLKFTPKDLHPISLGAAMCCDSAHKTLPVLTGGAYVHCAKDFSRAELKSCMSMVASTSPSYLTLASLDCCNRYLSEQASADFLLLEEKHKRLTELAGQKGFGNFIQNCDSTKLSLNIYSIGTDGADFAQLLRENNIEPEYVSKSHVVLLMTPFNSKQDFDRLEKVFNHIKINSQIKTERYSPMERRRVLSPHEAYFQQSEVVKVENSEGRICAETKIICPPGIPVVACGEQIDPIAQKLLKNSGINLIKVIK